MGGVSSIKQGQHTNENGAYSGISRRFSRNGSSKCMGASFFDNKEQMAICPSLMELCTHIICEVSYSFWRVDIHFMLGYFCPMLIK